VQHAIKTCCWTNQNYINEDLKNRLNSENDCFRSVPNLLFSRLLSRNLNREKYKTTVLPAVLYGSETWSLTLRKEHRLRTFENRMLTVILGPTGVTGVCRK
jgi:hypothetical protein